MLKKMKLKENDVVSVKINDDAYTVAQMRNNGIMQFFDLVQVKNEWNDIDLNDIPSLFFVFVAEKNMSSIFLEKLPLESVVPSKNPVPRKMLSAVIENAGRYGANLIELTDNFSSYEARIIKPDLNPLTDRDKIYNYELAGVYGDPEKIRKRLEQYFKTGVNWDSSKEFLFKDIPQPPPYRKKATQ